LLEMLSRQLSGKQVSLSDCMNFIASFEDIGLMVLDEPSGMFKPHGRDYLTDRLIKHLASFTDLV
ncbi:enhancer of rudimentary, partial [Kipferlia bialata]